MTMLRDPSVKYSAFPQVPLANREWPGRVTTQAPIWLSTDLRDGNQSLIDPMDAEKKTRFFDLLVKSGFKEIEVGFPASGATDFDYIQNLVRSGRVPADVTVQVLTQSRRDLIETTFASLRGAPTAIVHLYNAVSPTWRKIVFGMSKAEIKQIAVDGAKTLRDCAAAQPDTGGIEIDDAPVVRYLQKIMLDAINLGASDIHFEPYEKYYRIRYRRDGVLSEVAQPPMAIKDKVASRIKVLSRLDISEKRVPQDGRMKMVLSKNRAIDFRVSTLPTLYGEKIVMRILDPTSAQLGVDALGYEPWQKEILLDAVQRPYGMVLVTGPTGSGKTVSLYTCLNILNKPDVNISTAEDPAEIQLPGINQVNVNDKAGLTFSAALKSFLRQDPHVIMVGEIRDLETADIAIKAAQTGHMVMSTLHTNDAPGTLTRLLNMGVAPFNVASSVILITAQRLARRLCACKQPVDIPQEAMLAAGFTEEQLDGGWKPYKPVGCDICGGTGYKGRLGIYQVMPITDAMTRIILKGGDETDIADQARREGVLDLRQAGLLKVKAGLTSLEEVEAVTNI